MAGIPLRHSPFCREAHIGPFLDAAERASVQYPLLGGPAEPFGYVFGQAESRPAAFAYPPAFAVPDDVSASAFQAFFWVGIAKRVSSWL